MQLRQIKKSIFAALALLLVCLILLVSASYAWISISRVPEIVGIDTNVGAIGSLELALLNEETYLDPSLIRTTIGDSAVAQESTVSNLAWGNLIDLSDPGYGLSQIALYPTRLNVTNGVDSGDIVRSNILVVPTYGQDGRTQGIHSGTVSAVFSEEKFTFNSERQGYGVRAIGTIPNMTSQQTALATARSSVQSYTSAAVSSVESIWKSNGASLFNIYYRRFMLGSNSFTDAEVAVIRDTASRMLNTLGYLDSALRQGVVGYAASVLDNEDDFNTLRTAVENTSIPLSMVLGSISTNLPSGFSTWINTVESERLAMMRVVAACDMLEGDNYTWEMLSPMLNELVDPSKAYLGEHKLNSAAAFENASTDMVLTLQPGSGTMAHIADYAGNYDVFFNLSPVASVEVVTTSVVSPPYLAQISAVLDSCEAAAGDTELVTADLNEIYGYAIDMAFRCNAASDLLLQTEEALRVRDDSEFVNTQGGGSYMRFSSEQMSTGQIVNMMDAIRIGFIDNQNTLLAVAKLNTSNHEITDEGVTAPLYLYDFTVSADGRIFIGERMADDNAITLLPKNTAIIITAVIWLDGDYVGNGMAGYTIQRMEGLLNLQFASSADLQSTDQPISDDT